MACFGYLCGLKIGTYNLQSEYSEPLRSYKSACKEDPKLKSFDSQLKQRVTTVMKSLDDQTESPLPLASHLEVYGSVIELNQDAVREFIESKEDVWKNKDLMSLVEVYFKSTAKTLDFFNTVDNCVKRANNMQLIIQFALRQFKKESNGTQLGGNAKKKYSKTLGELNKFKAVGDPFGDEFMTEYKSVYDQQIFLLKEIRELIKTLDKKQRKVKNWRFLSNVVLGTALASVLVLSVVLTAGSVVPVVGAVASALTVPIERVGKWFSVTWKAYDNAVGKQQALATEIDRHAYQNSVVTITIKLQVDNLCNEILSILTYVDFAVERKEDETATIDAMKKIEMQVNEFTEKIKVVGENASKFTKFIDSGRTRVLEHIYKLPAN
ncbi:hypothetical protein V5N11_001091 [Cardamine amara subsp. amara]|uniref:Uncharacterized protein n=1 Tax=Cardamine amara subsp. amara TaxID=228776 RepID=A0ABD1C5A6_CARAN